MELRAEATGAYMQISFHGKDWEVIGGLQMCPFTPAWLIGRTAGK